mmetsp:Transcript_54159/g.100022  ORF Transcript_54159/g.100022 Transcript_54159/m.100022 type:complete len:232 (-) Transcript_54159:137-832(-)
MSQLLHTRRHHLNSLHHPDNVLFRQKLVAQQLACATKIENRMTNGIKPDNSQVARHLEVLLGQKRFMLLSPDQGTLKLQLCLLHISGALPQQPPACVFIAIVLCKDRQAFIHRASLHSVPQLLTPLFFSCSPRLGIPMHFVLEQIFRVVALFASEQCSRNRLRRQAAAMSAGPAHKGLEASIGSRSAIWLCTLCRWHIGYCGLGRGPLRQRCLCVSHFRSAAHLRATDAEC